ncbi:hypothetical protein CC85DRAFT_100607 [Cutaneotrichosporon oleaginosum]|uniref:Uncharacterized protein n=1 Tax=Cutaneotrichosporon oleaginosum TaxID=879819 RepID=A0A0J0XLQ4_9TREE|nr:uncharacterized protein CC85DRAFT_100607 [Cutaneotrichosporon oleaginosum]KLT41998.1 hypothetical protein CC85DRAFT_100607 [Cutaneotrichosporon oleaginosum]TXT14343.1 hypothetical protein COLE_00536 [Cutaneotrichosporon oleaginosum]
MLGEGRVARSEPPNNAPVYQHRHRPDMPPPPPAAAVQNADTNSSAGSSTSNGARSDAAGDVRRKVVGGFAMPNGASNGGSAAVNARQQAISRTPPESAADAAARRRAAIQASFMDEPQQPSIPSGGIDTVAARANENLRTHGADLGIANANGGLGGFASARGVKRER